MQIKFILPLLFLAACNSVHYVPDSLDTSQPVFAQRGGYTMRRSIKTEMSRRGYNVLVGRATRHAETDDLVFESDSIPNNARYIIKVTERREMFRPIWCALNGFWWWNFNVSIADQKTQQEIMTWRGRGCANSSVRKLNTILDEMEGKNNGQATNKK